MNFAAMIFPQRIVEALGWTLFHALWQGALAALGFAVILYVSRRGSSRLRYGLGLGVLTLVLLLSVLTFWSHYEAGAPAAPGTIFRQAVPAPAASAAGPAAAPANGEASPSQRITAFFSDYFGRHLPLIVTFWLLGVLFLTLRFSGSLLYVQRLKYRQNRPLPQLWQDRLQELAARAGLRRPLRLLESLRLKTPVVIGHLKPVLLLPAGLVSGLPADEVEALLAHELAHVLRRDYLVNVLQSLVDILFFFHPGMRWISAAVRQEREHCCDDFAVELCGDARSYALALARLQGAGPGTPEPALAASGRGHKLLHRIARLLTKPALARDFREGFVSALLLVFCLFAMLKLAGATADPGSASAQGAIAGAVASGAGGEEKSPSPLAAKAEVKSRFALVSFVLEADGIVRLDGTLAPGAKATPGTWLVDDSDGQVVWYMALAEKSPGSGVHFSEDVPLGSGAYSWYRPAGCQAAAQWRNAAGMDSWEPLTMFVPKGDRLLRGRGAEDELLSETVTEREREQEHLLQAKELRRREEELRTLSGAERERKEKELRERKEKEWREYEARMAVEEKELREHEARMRRQESEMRAGMEKQERLLKEQLRLEESRLRQEESRLRDEEMKFKKFMAELVAAGLVDEAQGYEVKLSASSLLVNGKKQPAAVHVKFRQFFETLSGQKLDNKRTVTIVHDKK